MDKPFAEKPGGDRGQFWNVDRHIRGRWIGAAASLGFFAAVAYLWFSDAIERSFGPLVGYFAVCIAASAALGFVAASIWRRFTGED